MSVCKRWRERSPSFFRMLVAFSEWTPINKLTPTSQNRQLIFYLFQEDIYSKSLLYLYILYSLMSVGFLSIFFANEYPTILPLNDRNTIFLISLTVFSIFYHVCLFFSIKLYKIRRRIRRLFFLFNAVSLIVLYYMTTMHGSRTDLNKNRTEEVVVSVLFISAGTFYFQNSFMASLVYWTLVCLKCLVGISSASDSRNYVSVVRVIIYLHFFCLSIILLLLFFLLGAG